MKTEQNVANTMRIQWIDFAKGIAIFFVVFGHVVELIYPQNSINNIIHMVIYSFHMPFFFMLSGMMFSDEKYLNFRKFVSKKVASLIVPSYTFAIITILINVIKELINTGTIVSIGGSGILRTLLQYRVGANSNYWYLPTLFFGLLIMWCIHRIFEKDSHRIIVSILISIIGASYIHWIAKPLPFSIDNAVLVCVFLELGYQLKDKMDELKGKKNLLLIIVGIMWLFSLYVNYKYFGGVSISLAYVTLLNPLLFFVGALAGSLLLLSMCSKTRKVSCINSWGKNTLVIYWLNVIIIDSISNIINKSKLDNSLIIVFLCLIISIIVIGITNILSIFIKKYCPYILGMKNKSK